MSNDIAPDYIKSSLAHINFEKRQGNAEKAKELYFKLFKSCLAKPQKHSQQATFVVVQYARYISYG